MPKFTALNNFIINLIVFNPYKTVVKIEYRQHFILKQYKSFARIRKTPDFLGNQLSYNENIFSFIFYFAKNGPLYGNSVLCFLHCMVNSY